MAIETTPLGFQKPDGNELARNGDNLIAANGAKAEELHQDARGRLTAIESKNSTQDGRLNAVEAKNSVQDGTLATHAAHLANLDHAAGFTGDPLELNDLAFAETLENGVATAAALDTRLTARVQPIVAAVIASDTAPATAAANAVSIALTNSDILKGTDVRAGRSIIATGYALPFTDATGYVSGGILSDGRWNFEKTPQVKGQADVTMRPLNATGWAIPFADKDGYVAGGIKNDGTAEFAKLNLTPANLLKLANETIGYPRSSRTKIAAIGDSLTDGYFGGVGNQDADSYPSRLREMVPAGVQVFNLGNSGYTTDEEAVRIGAIPLPLTVTGGSIPASGPVDVTTTAVIGWRATGTVRTIPGTLAGIPGTLTRNASDTVFSFTRTTDGSAVTVPAGTVYVPDFAGHAGDTAIILLGRNNVSYSIKGADATIGEHVAKGIDRIVNWLTPQIKQVLVVSATTTTSETSGTGGYTNIADINARLAAAYPSRFLNLRSYLVNQAIYDLGITPTSADLATMAADTLPASIMDGGTDNTHWSKATATLVAAQINNYLTTRGWV
ncbi:hypothetical protein ACFRJ8_14645 [Arthrobacter sp. NPDC056886]|uniref:hypothetical protein n=1 Tax=Arthrobacter sp. NPDC056886 TaxID=3345960 RepID=UPI00366AB5D2